MSVVENTTLAVLPRMAAGFFLDSERERALTAGFIARFAIKARSPDVAVATLSGGNQQKVALARWLATDPVVLILDEPTQGVDVGAKAEIHKLMGDLAEQGIAIVMISSELPEILGMSDRIAIMRGGTIVATVDRAGATPEVVLALALGHETTDGAPTADRPPPRQPSVSRRPAPPRSLARHRREVSVGLALAGLLVFLAWRAPGFFAIANLRDLFVSNAPVLVAAVGMALVILSRQIDISIGSQFAIGGVAAGLLAKTGLPMPLVAVGSLGVGALLGALNGALVVGLGLPSIVATLATMVFLREMLRWATEGVWVQDLPVGFQWFGLGQEPGRAAVVLVASTVFALFAWSLRRLAAGRSVYATGSEPEAARLVGIRPGRVVFGVFVVMGATTGLAALLTSIQFIDVQTNAGVGLEMKVIAAVVVGGTAITGGRGTLMGTLLGVALLGVIGPALTFLGTEAHWERALQGLVILLAVTADALESRKGDADR
jgi:rhamnose transport system permease protein